jgi:SAM-dependent methyltransferase
VGPCGIFNSCQHRAGCRLSSHDRRGSRWPEFENRWQTCPVGSIVWDREIAEVYDTTYAAQAEPSVVGPMVDLLTELVGDGTALEFAIGTGRIALALSARGIPVHGIELSPSMVDQFRPKPGANAIPVTVGDMTTTRLPHTFDLVYVVANSIMNVTTQEEQIAVFSNAAAHLVSGGRFVIELMVPQLRRVPLSENARVFRLDAHHVGIETFDDVVGQVAWSHHWVEIEGRLVHHSAPYRYIWPSELVLMARLAGFELEERWADWDRSPFAAESDRQVAVFVKTGQADPEWSTE